jgi:curli biogenesis system outer membrane secretion channel CsgG
MKLQSTLKIAFATVAVAILAGCSTVPGVTSVTQGIQGATVSQGNAHEPAQVKALSCPAPVMTISLAKLQCKAGECQSKNQGTGNMAALIALANAQEGIPDLSGFGDGMTDMLTSSLASTGCFDMLDRELMAELAREQQLAGREMSLQSADMMATGAITSLSYDRAKSNFGGGFVPVIGGVSTSKVTAKIGMDVRVVDVNTGRVVHTRTYNAESGKRSFGIAGGGLIGSGIAGGSHSVKGGVEMEEAAREIIHNVTNDMVETLVPAGGYNVQYIEVAKN